MADQSGYLPTPGPNTDDPQLQQVVQWTQRELEALARQFTNFDVVQQNVLHVEPDKPREGMIVVADGVNWNPGHGAGQYTYIGGVWIYSGNTVTLPPATNWQAIETYAGTDFNTFLTSGIYYVPPTSTNGPPGTDAYYHLLVQQYPDLVNHYITQTATELTVGTSRRWVRNCTSGTWSAWWEIGQPIVPQKIHSVSYQFVITDSATLQYFNGPGSGGGNGFVIPANSAVPFVPGTCITIFNGTNDANPMVIVQGDTVLWPPSNVSGNRILAYLGLATIIKVHPTLWIITGAGIS